MSGIGVEGGKEFLNGPRFIQGHVTSVLKSLSCGREGGHRKNGGGQEKRKEKRDMTLGRKKNLDLGRKKYSCGGRSKMGRKKAKKKKKPASMLAMR